MPGQALKAILNQHTYSLATSSWMSVIVARFPKETPVCILPRHTHRYTHNCSDIYIYSTPIGWLRARLSFSLLRSLCISTSLPIHQSGIQHKSNIYCINTIIMV